MTRIAARADVWLQLRPGTDAALALGILNVIVNEELYDREFVENFVYGWEPFVKRVNEYPLDKVEEINSMIRTLLAKKVYINRVPELKFFIDDTQDYVEKMDNLFKKIKDDNEG